jgi:hypothetical protein
MGALTSLSKEATSFCLAASELALLFFALLVAVGLIGEYKLHWWNHRLWLFELLVAIGCAGELLADGGVFAFSRRLENLSNIEVGKAVTDARKAIEQANSQRKLSEAIVRRILGRQISPYFLPALKMLPPAKAEVMCAEDPEAHWLAILLLQALRDAKWNVPRAPTPLPPSQFQDTDLPYFGNVFVSRNGPKMFFPFGTKGISPEVLMQMMDIRDARIALLAVELDLPTFSNDRTMPADLFRIVIGPRDPTK